MKENLLLGLSAAAALLLLELTLALATRAGLLPIEVPSYSLARARERPFLRDSNPDFGVWHEPNASSRHQQSCFDVTYRSNSYGARDVERALDSPHPRVVVLGDSMIEGFGLPDEQRLSNRLERETGIEHLNFATAGGFGTTQYYLLYKTLASRFSHAAVIVGMLPDNDFQDNDYEYGRQVYPDRYRPYLVGEYPSYRLVYYRSSLVGDGTGWLESAQRVLSQFSYGYQALAKARRLLTARLAPDRSGPAGEPRDAAHPYSGFYDYRKDQLDLVKYTFEQIGQLAGARKVFITLLPMRGDLQRYAASGASPLGAELERFAAGHGMELVDLLPEMARRPGEWDGYFLTCDGHWSAEGNAVAARYLRDRLAPLYRGLEP